MTEFICHGAERLAELRQSNRRLWWTVGMTLVVAWLAWRGT
jgi:hypothetical protein